MSSIANNVFNSSYSDVQAALSSGSLSARFKSLNVTGIESNKDVMTDSSGNFVGTEPADLSNYVSKTELTTQTLAGDLNLPSGIGNVNVGAELGTVITQTSGNTANITTLQNKTQHQSENGGYTDFNSFIRYQGFPYENPTALNHVTSKAYVDNQVNTKAGRTVSTDNPTSGDDVNDGYSIGDIWVNEEGTQSFICVKNSVDAAEWELFGNDQSLNTNDNVSFNSVNTPAISSSSGDVTVSSPLIVDNTIKLNNTIYDANGKQAYIMSRPSLDTFKLGANVNVGAACLGIGQNVGYNQQTKTDNVLIGINVGQSLYNYGGCVVIGTNCGNNISNTIGGSVVIGNGSNYAGIARSSVYIGQLSGINSAGERNICIGRQSGTNITSGKNCTFLGTDSSSTAGTLDEQIAIGYNAQTTAANQCVIGSTDLAQFQSDGFRDLDTKSAHVLGIGKTNATKVEIAKTGVITEVKGDLTASGGVEIRDYTTSAPTDALSGKLYKAASDERIHWLTNTNDYVLAYKTEVDSKAGRTVSTEFPSADDDVDRGYSIGDIWVNEEGTQSFICVNNSVGLAEWELFGNDQSLNTNDNVSFTSVNTPAISSWTDVTVSSPLIVDNTIKLNNFIYDANGDQAYIMSRPSLETYTLGANVNVGASCLGIGHNVGYNQRTGPDCVLIGINVGQSLYSYGGSVVIGSNCGNNISNTNGGSVVIGHVANRFGLANGSVYIGQLSGYNSDGVRNICIGYKSGTNITSGKNCTFLGTDSSSTAGTLDEQIAIGWNAQTTAANQCVIGSTDLAQFQSDGFRDLDTKSANVLGIGKTNATKVEIAKTGVTTEVKGNLTVGGQIQSSSPTMVLSPLPPGDGSAGVVESYGVLKVIDDDGFKLTLSLQAADGLGQGSDTGPLYNNAFFTSLMLKDKTGAVFPWLTLENTGGGPLLQGRTSIYCQNDLVMRLSSTFGVQAFYRVRCSDTTPSTSTTTGSITTAGGLGVVGDVNIGGKVNGLTPIGGVFAQTSTVSITSLDGNTEQSLVGSGVGSLTVPANTFKVGDSYSLKIGGTKTNGNHTIQIKIKTGSVIIAQSGLISLSSLSAEPYEIKLEFTIRAVGGAGVASVSTSGIFTYTDSGVYKGYNFNQINSTTFNTTVDNTLNVTVIQSFPGNNMTSSSFILTKIY